MITVLQNIARNYVAKIFLWIFLIVLVVGGISFDFSDNKPWVIKINKERITELDYRSALANSQRQYDYLKAQGITWPRTESIEKEVVRHLVSSGLMLEQAGQLGLVVPSVLIQEQLHGQLSSLPAYFFDEQGQLKIDMLEKIIAPKSFESLLQDMENEIKSNLLYSLLSLGSYVAEFEIAEQYIQDYADKKYSVLKYSLDQIKDEVASDQILEKFYKKSEHGDLYKTAEKRAGNLWRFNAQEYGLSVTKKEIVEYYEQYKQSNYLEAPAQVKVNRIFFAQSSQDQDFNPRAQADIIHEEVATNPTTFAEVAKKIQASNLPYQGSNITDYFAKDSTEYDKIFKETAFEQLAQDGDISQVIKTDKGYEILQRVGRKSAEYKHLDTVEKEISDKILENKFSKRFKQDAERIVSQRIDNKDVISSFIKKRHGKAESLSLQIKKPGAVSMHLFQTEAHNFAIFMDGKDGILLESTHIEKRALQPFNQIKTKVQDDYAKKIALEKLQVTIQNMMQDAATMDFTAIAEKYNAHLEVVQANYVDGHMNEAALLKNSQVAQKVKMLKTVNSLTSVTTSLEGYVIRLDEVAPIDQALFAEKKSSIASMLESKIKHKGRDSFIALLYRHGKLNNKIEIKDQLIKDIKDTSL